MVDSAKVRLVRCPKCENLLPELAGYSVYRCGGCGTVLRANDQDGETLSPESGEERAEGASSKSRNSIEKDAVDVDTEVESNILPNGSDTTSSVKNDVQVVKKSENQSNMATDKRVDENNLKDIDDLSTSAGGENGVPTSLSTEGTQTVERNSRNYSKGVRFSTSTYSKEGTSNTTDPLSGFEHLLKTHFDKDRANKINQQEQGRAEFLRRLDELKDQFSQQSSDVVDKTKDKVPMVDIINLLNPHDGYDNWRQDGTSGSNRVPRQFSMSNKQGPGPPLSGSPQSKGYYPSMRNPNNVSRFDDPYGQEMNVGGLYQFPNSYRRQPHSFHSRQFSDANLDSLVQFHHNPILHQPSCTCYRCFESYQQVSAPSAYYDRRVQTASIDSFPCHPEHESPYGRYVNNSRIGFPVMNFRDRQPHSRWSSDIQSDISGFSASRPRRMLHGGRARRYRAVSGGAPFLACYNCFELLLLPKKVRRMAKNEHKICCGACSAIIKFGYVNNKLMLSEQEETKQIPLDVDNSGGNVVRESAAQCVGPVKHSSYNFSSDDYDNSGYEFQAVDQDPALQPSVPSLSSDKQHVLQSFHCSSPSVTEEEENSPEVLINPVEITKKFDQPTDITISPPPPASSPLQSYFEHSSNNHVGDKLANGNQSNRLNEEKMKSSKVTSRQNSLKDASPVTEMEVPKNEYSNIVTKEYSNTYSVRDQSRTNKVGDSFFASIIKKSFRSNRALGKSSVSVNGHFILDKIVKKAEKLAGRIHPGEYWYDARAGFWGVMGGPCLGIIPPFIEELNHPMPEDCASGNTGIYVNGRQLHQKDLDLLSGRGLPTLKDRSYIIEISGRVVDEDTGEEMDGLGRLAPTIEKVKHGFGMKVPRAAS